MLKNCVTLRNTVQANWFTTVATHVCLQHTVVTVCERLSCSNMVDIRESTLSEREYHCLIHVLSTPILQSPERSVVLLRSTVCPSQAERHITIPAVSPWRACPFYLYFLLQMMLKYMCRHVILCINFISQWQNRHCRILATKKKGLCLTEVRAIQRDRVSLPWILLGCCYSANGHVTQEDHVWYVVGIYVSASVWECMMSSTHSQGTQHRGESQEKPQEETADANLKGIACSQDRRVSDLVNTLPRPI